MCPVHATLSPTSPADPTTSAPRRTKTPSSHASREHERHLKRAAALLELHKHKGIPYDPSQDGFVFSKDEVEAFAQRPMRLNQSRHIEHVLFHMQPPAPAAAS